MSKLWGGRFEGSMDALIEKLNNSLPFDQRLWKQDIQGSLAHAAMLGATGIIPQAEAEQIIAGLQSILSGLENGSVTLPQDAEDIHSAVESKLRELIGPVAGKLHTARSRNDQVATDIRLYLREAIDQINGEISSLLQTLLESAEPHTETILPGYTHLQHAQPIVLAHHLLAYFWMLERDRERFTDCRKRVNRSPLGAAAMAGTGFPIDRERTANELGFESVLPNSLDAVSDRDFAVEFLAAASITIMHLSRLAEDFILWNTVEFGFVQLSDAVTTGSSIMPQKKNPDVAELVRGKTGRIYGNLQVLLVLMKGLPLAYNKDIQEDKEPVFDTVDTLLTILPAMRLTLQTAQFQNVRMLSSTAGDFSTATDLADWLVRKDIPFREAHGIVGRIVRYCIENQKSLEDLTVEDLSTFTTSLSIEPQEALSVLSVESSVRSRNSQGGTAPESVKKQWLLAKSLLGSA